MYSRTTTPLVPLPSSEVHIFLLSIRRGSSRAGKSPSCVVLSCIPCAQALKRPFAHLMPSSPSSASSSIASSSTKSEQARLCTHTDRLFVPPSVSHARHPPSPSPPAQPHTHAPLVPPVPNAAPPPSRKASSSDRNPTPSLAPKPRPKLPMSESSLECGCCSVGNSSTPRRRSVYADEVTTTPREGQQRSQARQEDRSRRREPGESG